MKHKKPTEPPEPSIYQDDLRHSHLLPKPVKPPPLVCKRCGLKNRRYATRDNGTGKRYYNLVCSGCRGAERRRQLKAIRAKLSPEEAYRLARNDQLKTRFKITLDEYEKLLESQGNVCAICRERKGLYNMPLDHDHATGKNRGILCHYCNKGLGHFYDNSKLLKLAIEYLEKWNEPI